MEGVRWKACDEYAVLEWVQNFCLDATAPRGYIQGTTRTIYEAGTFFSPQSLVFTEIAPIPINFLLCWHGSGSEIVEALLSPGGFNVQVDG